MLSLVVDCFRALLLSLSLSIMNIFSFEVLVCECMCAWGSGVFEWIGV